MNMKKLYTLMLTALMALTFTACEDQRIANSLEGTWSGNMEVSSVYDGRRYYATHTEITFSRDPYRYAQGTGYWVDYYSGAPWDYVANHITWTVDNARIRVYFQEEGTSFTISNYRLSGDRFSGYIADGGNDVYFDLMHVASPNWNNYRYWGYDDWYSGHYYSRQTRTDDTTAVQKPIRQIGVKAE